MKLLKNYFYLIITILMSLLVGIAAYYFLYQLPGFHEDQLKLQKQEQVTETKTEKVLLEMETKRQNQEQQQQLIQEFKQKEEQQREADLDNCLQEAEYIYGELVKFLNEEWEEPDCKDNLGCKIIINDKSDEIKEDLASEKEECFKRYGS